MSCRKLFKESHKDSSKFKASNPFFSNRKPCTLEKCTKTQSGGQKRFALDENPVAGFWEKYLEMSDPLKGGDHCKQTISEPQKDYRQRRSFCLLISLSRSPIHLRVGSKIRAFVRGLLMERKDFQKIPLFCFTIFQNEKTRN